MKRIAVISVYWVAAILLSAAIIVSFGYSFPEAATISSAFIPCAFALDQIIPRIREREKSARIKNSIFVILGVLTSTFLLIMILQVMVFLSRGTELLPNQLPQTPPVLSNPVFVALLLTAMAIGEHFLMKAFPKATKSDRKITFTSNYRKVSLNRSDILFIESRDNEVWIYTSHGDIHKNRTPISHWENYFGDDFIRTHRSYLVNKAAILSTDGKTIFVPGHEIPVSKKYSPSIAIPHNNLDIANSETEE